MHLCHAQPVAKPSAHLTSLMAVRVAGGAAVDPIAAGGAPGPSAQAGGDAALHAAVAHLSADVVLEELERSGCLATLTALKTALQNAGGSTDGLVRGWPVATSMASLVAFSRGALCVCRACHAHQPEELEGDERVRAFQSAKLGEAGTTGDTPASRLGLMVRRHACCVGSLGAWIQLGAALTCSPFVCAQVDYIRAASKRHGRRGHRHG